MRATKRFSPTSSARRRRVRTSSVTSLISLSRLTRGVTPTQAREAAGIAALAAAILIAISLITGGGAALRPVAGLMETAFGVAWVIPVVLLAVAGMAAIWPRRLDLRPAQLTGSTLVALAVVGLLGLGFHQGGRVGAWVARGLAERLTAPGAGVLLLAGLLIGLVLGFQVSVGRIVDTGLVVASAVTGWLAATLVPTVKRLAAAGRRMVASSGSGGRPPRGPATGIESRADDLDGVEAGLPDFLKAEPRDLSGRSGSGFLPALVDPPLDPERESAERRARGRATAGGEQLEVFPAVMRVVAEPIDDAAPVIWKLPSTVLLDSVSARREKLHDEVKRNVRIIESTLAVFGVKAQVVGVNPGPTVTQYEVQPGPGVQVKRITALQHDLELALAASPLRMEAPIPGKSAIGIEVPNRSASLVSLREVVESSQFTAGHQMAIGFGHDVSGSAVVGDLTRMPHLLIAGATGQGKSVCINGLIAGLLLQKTPEQLKLVLIDPKRVEMTGFADLPHLAVPVINETHQAAAALRWAVAEMERRYKLLAAEGVRNIVGYNERAVAARARTMPYVVIVIDELADLMMVAAGEVEELICRIAQLARAVGIHLVVATQRPSADIITGLIKANIPSRIAFAVGSQVDSRVILDTTGAEKLLGRGDMLYLPVEAGKPLRVQGAFVSDGELAALVDFWRRQGEPRYYDEVLTATLQTDGAEAAGERRMDPLFARAARVVAAEGGASVSLIQRKFNVGYSRAGRIVDQLADHRVVGGYQGSKSREVLMTLPDVDELLERLGIEG